MGCPLWRLANLFSKAQGRPACSLHRVSPRSWPLLFSRSYSESCLPSLIEIQIVLSRGPKSSRWISQDTYAPLTLMSTCNHLYWYFLEGYRAIQWVLICRAQHTSDIAKQWVFWFPVLPLPHLAVLWIGPSSMAHPLVSGPVALGLLWYRLRTNMLGGRRAWVHDGSAERSGPSEIQPCVTSSTEVLVCSQPLGTPMRRSIVSSHQKQINDRKLTHTCSASAC